MFHSKIFMLWDSRNQFGNYNINIIDLYTKFMQPFVTNYCKVKELGYGKRYVKEAEN